MPCASNPENDFSPGDNESVILRKILARLCTVGSGGSGGGVSQAYVDAGDAATLLAANNNAVAGDAATLAAAMSSASALYVLKAGDTMTGALLQPAGTVGAPALARSGDTDTGLWYPAANTWAISTAGAERLRILSTGEVGIGVSTPSSKLEVFGTNTAIPTTNVYQQFEITGDTAGIQQRLSLGVLSSAVGGAVAGTGFIQALSNAQAFRNIAINPTGGNVGIGIAIPIAKLHITPSASGTDYFRIDHSDGTPRVQVGVRSDANSFSALWFGNIVPGVTNFSIDSNGADTEINSPSGILYFENGGTLRWMVSSGHFLAATDNTYDIGASGATRPRNYFGAGTVNAAGGLITGNVASLVTSSAAMNDGAAAALGTLTNAPAAGNPTKWIPINDNGTTRYIPTW